jgi:hypothetical protein
MFSTYLMLNLMISHRLADVICNALIETLVSAMIFYYKTIYLNIIVFISFRFVVNFGNQVSSHFPIIDFWVFSYLLQVRLSLSLPEF